MRRRRLGVSHDSESATEIDLESKSNFLIFDAISTGPTSFPLRIVVVGSVNTVSAVSLARKAMAPARASLVYSGGF